MNRLHALFAFDGRAFRVLRKAALACLGAASPLIAADVTWNGGGADNNWATGQNWVGGAAPTSAGADRLIFSGTTRPMANNSYVSGLFRGIAFDATAASFFLSGNEFSVGDQGFVNQSSQGQTVGPSVNFTDSAVVSNVAGGSTTFLGLNMGIGTSTITFAGAGDTTIASTMTGTTGNVVKTDAGTLTATGAWNQAGNVIVRGGVMAFSGSVAIAPNLQSIRVGDQAGDAGTLNVVGGAKVTSQQGILGNVLGSTGVATVSGEGSEWKVTNDLMVGRLGQGSLSVLGGGLLTSQNASIGGGVIASDNTGSKGAVSVQGAGSRWVNQGNLVVGGYGSGTLDVLSGAEVSVQGDTVIAAQTNPTASVVTVGGIGSKFATVGNLTVGGAGTGTVNVTGGAVMESGSATLGSQAGSTGTVTVVGAGSAWGVVGLLNVGNQGTGTVSISSGGAVQTGTISIGALAGSTGAITVDGTGSSLTASGNMTVGQAGTGSFTVQGGASASTGATSIGSGAGSVGTATVNGTGSIWSTTGNITIGTSGTGTLIVQNGGVLNVNGGAGTISLGAGTAELNVGGGGSAGTINAAAVNFGSATNILRFDYGGATTFSARLSGAGTLLHENGNTTISNANTAFNGVTSITGGVLRTTNVQALGSSDVQLSGGSLAPVGNLALNSFGWTNTASVIMSLGTTNSRGLLTVGGTATKSGTGRFVLYDDGTFQADTPYALMVAGGGYTGYNLADLRAEFVYALGAEFSFSPDGKTLYITYPSSLAPKEIDNAAPISTDPNANFFVVGNVTTSNAPNTIRSLAFNNNSELRVFNNLTVTSGLFHVGVGSASVVGDTLTAPNGFTKTGAGLLDMAANLVVTGTANIVNGTLAVNGVLTAQELVVETAAFLKGNGIINADVVNNGTLSPGNSPGTLTVNGNFTQTSTGVLQIEIASGSNFDRLLVSQTASLAGTLQVIGFSGFAFKYGQQFAFLQANRIEGGFGSIQIENPSQFRARFVVNGEMGTILIAPTSYTLLAQNSTQKGIAQALDSFIPATSGDQQTVSIALDMMTADQYPQAFNEVAPVFYQNLANIALEQMSAENQIIAQRLSLARMGGRGFTAQNIEMPIKNDRDGSGVMDPKGVIEQDAYVSGETRWSAWAQANGNMAKVTNVSQVPNYNYWSGGMLIGVDYRWSDSFVTGLYTGYQGTYAKDTAGDSTLLNTVMGGMYATYKYKGFYTDAIVGGAYNNYNSRRNIAFSTINRTAKSETSGGQFSSYLGMGYDWKWGGLIVGPLISAQYIYTGLGPISEGGAQSLDLRISQQNVNSFRTNVGGHIAYKFQATKNVIIFPQVRATWQHEYMNKSRNLSSSLNGGAGPSFNYATSETGTDSILTSGGITVQVGEYWSASAYYSANVGNSNLFDQAISLSIDYSF